MADWINDEFNIPIYTVSVDLTGRVPSKAKKGVSVTFNVRESFLDR